MSSTRLASLFPNRIEKGRVLLLLLPAVVFAVEDEVVVVVDVDVVVVVS